MFVKTVGAHHTLGAVLSALPLQRYLTRRVYQRCQLDCNHSYLQRLTYLKVESLELRYDIPGLSDGP